MGDHRFALVLAPISVPFSRIGSWFGEWAGSKLGGVGTREQVRAAYAWAAVPAIAWGVVFWPVQLGLFGSEMFRTATPLIDSANVLLLLFIAGSSLVAIAWSAVIGVQAFAEVHQFSAWRSLGSFALMVGIVLLPLVALLVVALSLSPK